MYDDIGIEKYVMLCKELQIVPISRIVKSLPEDTINLKVQVKLSSSKIVFSHGEF